MSKPFKFAIDAERALPEVLQMVMHVRASVDALTVLTIETLAEVSHTDPVAIVERYEKLKADALLLHAFEVQENAGVQNPERQNPS